jgi:TrmH family RNA methyltransferase
MIPIDKLAKLAPRHRMRKAALVLRELERGLMLSPEGEEGLEAYARALANLLASAAEAPEELRDAAALLASEQRPGAGDRADFLRAVDGLRHALLSATGQAPADWDLIDPRTGQRDPSSRRVHPGIKVFLEDLRSPYNIGSIFRTADAFGLEEIILSPACAEPRHPRSERSAMGAVDLVPWRRARLESLDEGLPLFALEVGGEEIGDFDFPPRGIAILGSEELGISPEARRLSTYGIASIPMSGAKGSLNVAVAFGIMMHAWTSSLDGWN